MPYKIFGESDPKVVLFGEYHKGSQGSEFETELCNLINQLMNVEDILLVEGKDGQLIPDPRIYRESTIRHLHHLVARKRARIFSNDSTELIKLSEENENERHRIWEKYYSIVNNGPQTEESLGLVRRIKRLTAEDTFIHEMRDQIFSHGEYGIIPFVQKGTSRVFQLIGSAHLYAENISGELEKLDIPYVMIIPKGRET